ncbi:hypothetical protein FRB95_003990 [Tulasnella sp. JGI-2019a]|nr:hypothetical protein FRB95_003990 [Tulasnella sp. JGI-2019a]
MARIKNPIWVCLDLAQISQSSPTPRLTGAANRSWMHPELATLQEDESRRRFRERDSQILSAVFILSTINLAISASLFITAYSDLEFTLLFWSILRVYLLGYSAVYIYAHGNPECVPGNSETFSMVPWAVLGIVWIRGCSIKDSSAPKLRWDIYIATAFFHLLSLTWLLLIGHGLYWRYLFNSKNIIEARASGQEMSTLSSCGLQHLIQSRQLVQCPTDSDPSQYIITHVGWWQQKSFWKHQYVIVRAFVSQFGDSSTRYFRVERHKTGWFTLSNQNILDYILYSAAENDLTRDSTLVSDFEVSNPEEADRSGYSIEMLGHLINIINTEAPSYSLASVNCWWFAGCTFERLAQRLGPNRMRAYTSVSIWERREQNYTDLIESCYSVYYHLHWPYWGLPCWAFINFNASIQFNDFNTTVIILVWVGISLQYWTVASAWTRVRNRFKDAGDGDTQFGFLFRLQQFGWQVGASVLAAYAMILPLILVCF